MTVGPQYDIIALELFSNAVIIAGGLLYSSRLQKPAYISIAQLYKMQEEGTLASQRYKQKTIKQLKRELSLNYTTYQEDRPKYSLQNQYNYIIACFVTKTARLNQY